MHMSIHAAHVHCFGTRASACCLQTTSCWTRSRSAIRVLFCGVWGLHVAFKENNGLPSAAILHCFGPHDGFVTVATGCWPMQRSQLVSQKQIHTLPPFLLGNSSVDLPTVQQLSSELPSVCTAAAFQPAIKFRGIQKTNKMSVVKWDGHGLPPAPAAHLALALLPLLSYVLYIPYR